MKRKAENFGPEWLKVSLSPSVIYAWQDAGASAGQAYEAQGDGLTPKAWAATRSKRWIVRKNCEYSIAVEAESADAAVLKAAETSYLDWDTAWAGPEAEEEA